MIFPRRTFTEIVFPCMAITKVNTDSSAAYLQICPSGSRRMTVFPAPVSGYPVCHDALFLTAFMTSHTKIIKMNPPARTYSIHGGFSKPNRPAPFTILTARISSPYAYPSTTAPRQRREESEKPEKAAIAGMTYSVFPITIAAFPSDDPE